MVVYFSGTGNSRYCAQLLAHRLGDELVDASGFIKHGIAAELISGKPWVFVAPVYAWQMARVFAGFIRTGNFDGSRDAYFVLTCGGDMGNAAQSIEELCREKGFDCKGVLEVPMPENYVAMFSVPDEAACEKMIAAAHPVLERAADRIRAGLPLERKPVRLMDKLKSGPINQGFYAAYVKAKKFYATDACISCGKCVDGCVLNNITLKDGKPSWGERCTHCMACICACPAQAIEYGKTSVGKARYQCREYKENR